MPPALTQLGLTLLVVPAATRHPSQLGGDETLILGSLPNKQSTGQIGGLIKKRCFAGLTAVMGAQQSCEEGKSQV